MCHPQCDVVIICVSCTHEHLFSSHFTYISLFRLIDRWHYSCSNRCCDCCGDIYAVYSLPCCSWRSSSKAVHQWMCLTAKTVYCSYIRQTVELLATLSFYSRAMTTSQRLWPNTSSASEHAILNYSRAPRLKCFRFVTATVRYSSFRLEVQSLVELSFGPDA